MIHRILLVASDVFVRRLTPALSASVPMQIDYRIVDIHRKPRELVEHICQLEPAGIITESLPRLTDAILGLGLPTVVADSDVVYRKAVSIDVDDVAVGVEAAQFFLAAGHRHLACVYGRSPYSLQRLEGFRREAEKHGAGFSAFRQVETPARHYMESWNEPTDRLREWLLKLPKSTAVFAVHDPLARLVAEAASEAGLHVPEEIAIVGANNDALVCGLSFPPLSSVGIPWDRIGALAAKWIVTLIEGGRHPRAAILVRPGSVCVRQSSALAAVEDSDVRRVIRYLRDHFRKPITIGSACEDLRVSRRTIERKFTLHLRMTPGDALCRLRIDEAKSLLLGTSQPIGIIAGKCGFSEPERFAVSFRRSVGTTPSAFRRERHRN